MIIAKDLVQRLEALKREEYDERDEAFNAAIDYAIDDRTNGGCLYYITKKQY